MVKNDYLAVHLLGPEHIELRRLPCRVPGPGEITVRIDAATTCGTDVKVYRRGGHPRMLTPPCPFGHEMAATVSEIGQGVTAWSPGDRVVIANSACCGDCGPCLDGRENLCERLIYLNGAFAEELLVPRRFVDRSLHRIPDHLQAATAALTEPLACVVHAYDHMALTGCREVLVIGGGPIGLMFAYLLSTEGHRVTLADPHRTRLNMAGELGAAAVYQITDREQPVTDISPTERGRTGFEVAIDATGSVAGWNGAVKAVRPGGVVNFFGGCAPGTVMTLDTHRLHYQELSLLGTYHHRPRSFARALEILADDPEPLQRLISSRTDLEGVEGALKAMMRREALKVAVLPRIR